MRLGKKRLGFSSAGPPPAAIRRGMGIVPGPAVAKLLREGPGLSWDDIDLVELNRRRFAAQVLALLKGWGLGRIAERLNVKRIGAFQLGQPKSAHGRSDLDYGCWHEMRPGWAAGTASKACAIGRAHGQAAVLS